MLEKKSSSTKCRIVSTSKGKGRGKEEILYLAKILNELDSETSMTWGTVRREVIARMKSGETTPFHFIDKDRTLPVDRAWAKFPDGSKVKDYWFSPRTMAALEDPEKLAQIREQFKRHMERRRLDKGYSHVANFLSWVASDPDKFERNPELPEMLSDLSRYLTAVVAGAGQKSAGG